MVFQRERPHLRTIDETFSAVAVAKQALSGEFDDDLGDGPDPAESPTCTLTIIEVAVPVRAPEFEGDTELRDAISAVQALQRAVALVTQEPVELLRTATLPMTVPATYGAVEPGKRPNLDGLALMMNTHASPLGWGAPIVPLQGEKLDAVRIAAERLSSGDVFDTYADLRREGMVQRSHLGNERLTVVLAAAGGEVLLDTVLLHLLWEEHVDPGTAAMKFPRDRSALLRTEENLSSRLGGNWHRTGSAPFAVYADDVVQMRNRVMHAGHDPTPLEAKCAWDALMELEQFIGDRLCSDKAFSRYPRTAHAWLGERGLRLRNRWVQRIQKLLDDPLEPNWRLGFVRWQKLVDRHLSPEPATPGRTGNNQFYFEIEPSKGTERWVCFDPETEMATVFDGSSVATPQMLNSLVEMRELLDTDAEAGTVRVNLMLDPTIVPLGDPMWVPSPDLLPELDYLPGPPRHRANPPDPLHDQALQQRPGTRRG